MKLQITKGEYKVQEATETSCAHLILQEKNVVMIMPIGNGLEKKEYEETNMATVCADALNSYQKEAVLPSELLDQNKQMKEALQESIVEIEKLKHHYKDVGHCVKYINKVKTILNENN